MKTLRQYLAEGVSKTDNEFIFDYEKGGEGDIISLVASGLKTSSYAGMRVKKPNLRKFIKNYLKFATEREREVTEWIENSRILIIDDIATYRDFYANRKKSLICRGILAKAAIIISVAIIIL